jgi:hypothetical protein
MCVAGSRCCDEHGPGHGHHRCRPMRRGRRRDQWRGVMDRQFRQVGARHGSGRETRCGGTFGGGGGALLLRCRWDLVVQGAAAFLEQPLHTLDRIALNIKQIGDSPQQHDIVGAIIAPSAAAFQRLDSGKLGLPEPQHVLGNMQFVRHLADGAICLGGFTRAKAARFIAFHRKRIGIHRQAPDAADLARSGASP